MRRGHSPVGSSRPPPPRGREAGANDPTGVRGGSEVRTHVGALSLRCGPNSIEPTMRPIQIQIVPYLLRPPVAHAYCGMSRAVFNREIRPFIREISLGRQSLAYVRADIDRALETFISRSAGPASQVCIGDENTGESDVTVPAAANNASKAAFDRAVNAAVGRGG